MKQSSRRRREQPQLHMDEALETEQTYTLEEILDEFGGWTKREPPKNVPDPTPEPDLSGEPAAPAEPAAPEEAPEKPAVLGSADRDAPPIDADAEPAADHPDTGNRMPGRVDKNAEPEATRGW